MIKLTRGISLRQMAWRNDPKINAWTRQSGLLSGDEMGKWRHKIENDPSLLMFGILGDISYNIDTQTSWEEIGTCGLTSISPQHGSAEFSLLIGPEYQRKGFGRFALRELLKYGFKNLRLNSIWGETFCGNPALKLFKELGMVEEGTRRQCYFKNGKYVDAHLISILRAEAEKKEWFNT